LEASENSRFQNLISQKLTELKEEILNAADGTRTVELDQQSVGRLSRMDAMQHQAMAIALENRRRVEVSRLQAAKTRIDEDEFGYCEECGEDIPTKRLEIDPATTRCVNCASR
jgi:DnaK suppressor protein